VWQTGLFMMTCRNDLTLPDNNRSNSRIGRGPTQSFTGLAQGLSHKFDVDFLYSFSHQNSVQPSEFNFTVNGLDVLKWVISLEKRVLPGAWCWVSVRKNLKKAEAIRLT
jgi:hypothetical protein